VRWTDVVIVALAACGAMYVTLFSRWAPGWGRSALIFAVLAVGLPVLRFLSRRAPRVRLLAWLADFWLVPAAALGHQALGPVVDSVRPELMDAYLASVDLRLFGAHPAVVLGTHAGPLLTELLLVCYYGYFVWPLALGVLLYRRGRPDTFAQYTLALALTYVGTFLAYIFVPAVGPRFFLAGAFPEPLEGVWLTPLLDSAMRGPVFMRDCFPSGHTAVTLVVLIFAQRYVRGFFWILLPAGLGLILGTLVGRFHYGVDLLVALPLAALATALATSLTRAPVAGAPRERVWARAGAQQKLA
jgi:hypothetical protein